MPFNRQLWLDLPRYLKASKNYLRKSLEFCEIGEKAEKLHWYTRSDDQQAHGEDDETAEFFTRAEDFVHEIFEQWGSFNQADNS